MKNHPVFFFLMLPSSFDVIGEECKGKTFIILFLEGTVWFHGFMCSVWSNSLFERESLYLAFKNFSFLDLHFTLTGPLQHPCSQHITLLKLNISQQKLRRHIQLRENERYEAKLEAQCPFQDIILCFCGEYSLARKSITLALWYCGVRSCWFCTFPFLCLTFIKKYRVWYLQLLWGHFPQRNNTQPYKCLILCGNSRICSRSLSQSLMKTVASPSDPFHV